MFINKACLIIFIGTVVLSACSGTAAPNAFSPTLAPVNAQGQGPATNIPQINTAAVATADIQSTATAMSTQSSSSDKSHTMDLTHLPLGDGKISSSPRVGYIFSCNTQSTSGGAFRSGDWFNGDGTWDATRKPSVAGSINWPSSFSITTQGDQRVISSNDLPNHPTGTFPIASSDPAYNFDHNPNSISSQNIQFSLPLNPQLAATPTCVGMGMIGIMTTGTVFFNALDAQGHDAVAHEIQDGCNGHPEKNGRYHYHNLSNCIKDDGTGQSKLVGYALDGFGIFGPRGADGRELTDADLDECHGITSEIEWNGQTVNMYHYVATREYPYTIGCFRGTPITTGNQPGGQGPSQNGQPTQGIGQRNGPPQGGNGGQPPQEALTACIGLSQGTACTVNTPRGSINGTCQIPPNLSQLACVPAGGPPKP